MSERENEAQRGALASTRMEGFEVTEQTEKDGKADHENRGLLCAVDICILALSDNAFA